MGSSINKKTKKYKTLILLAKGKSQSGIVKNMGYSESVVCKNTKYFLDKRWLICTTPNCHTKFYRATPKAPISIVEKGQVSDTKSHKGVYTRIHNKRWKIKILTKNKRKITWDKTVKLKNGVIKQYLYFPQITIEKIKKTVILYPHKQFVNDVELEKLDEFLENEMGRVVSWLMKLLQCRCSFPPEEIEDPEYAFPIMNPEIQRVLKRIGIMRCGDCWIDCSKKGFVWGELESTYPEKLKTMRMLQWSDMNIPNRVSKLENDMLIFINRLEEIFGGKNSPLSDGDMISYI